MQRSKLQIGTKCSFSKKYEIIKYDLIGWYLISRILCYFDNFRDKFITKFGMSLQVNTKSFRKSWGERRINGWKRYYIKILSPFDVTKLAISGVAVSVAVFCAFGVVIVAVVGIVSAFDA